MNGALVGLILVFLVVILAGKHVRRPGPRSYLFIVFLTMIQIAVVMFYIFTAKSPVAN